MRKGVPPVDITHVVTGFRFNHDAQPGDRVTASDPTSVCLECFVFGHICRRCRAERYHARQAAKRTRRARLRAWWRSTTLYRMNRDYPLATPFVFMAGSWWASLAFMVAACFITR